MSCNINKEVIERLKERRSLQNVPILIKDIIAGYVDLKRYC